MPAYLDDILVAHRARAAADRRDVGSLAAQAEQGPALRPFVPALTAASANGSIAVISEIKRRSPSKGPLDLDLDPAGVAVDYQSGGAACLSVLTDEDFFGGSAADLTAARAACTLPVLRKDFTVSEADVYDARIMGADAVLLIVAGLTDSELGTFVSLAGRLGLAALVEVHDAAELDRALQAGATLVGVNQRNLKTFDVDHDLALALAETFPAGIVGVAESGIRGAVDAARLADAGYHAVLVGETLVRSGDRRASVEALVGARKGRVGPGNVGPGNVGTATNRSSMTSSS
ncbi:MAG TPA: indole-3-glycerol phosphate synthase TrpC [Acidimicrobiales bacterium]|jgi:indole-3-glycerol phosphate synthase|nr:indole-3-glycerol phosphate synthase TrpC [Acidimicrobiales bacterium]